MNKCTNLINTTQVIQAKGATQDVEVSNIDTLLVDLVKLRSIWNEAKEVALNFKIENINMPWT